LRELQQVLPVCLTTAHFLHDMFVELLMHEVWTSFGGGSEIMTDTKNKNFLL
jgi:hypothetical protein